MHFGDVIPRPLSAWVLFLESVAIISNLLIQRLGTVLSPEGEYVGGKGERSSVAIASYGLVWRRMDI
jgi:hypothetical protein